MTVTYDSTDLSTNLAKVRLLIADIDTTTTTGNREDWTILFTDEEINSFLSQCDSDINLACAMAMRSIASSRVLLAKAVKIGDYEGDLTKVHASCLKSADAFEKKAAETPYFDYAEMNLSDFSARDITWNYDLRNG